MVNVSNSAGKPEEWILESDRSVMTEAGGQNILESREKFPSSCTLVGRPKGFADRGQRANGRCLRGPNRPNSSRQVLRTCNKLRYEKTLSSYRIGRGRILWNDNDFTDYWTGAATGGKS